jgi:hypothetical protein
MKPYVKRQKNDAADAEAICEAVTRANMRFVPTKTPARGIWRSVRATQSSNLYEFPQDGLAVHIWEQACQPLVPFLFARNREDSCSGSVRWFDVDEISSLDARHAASLELSTGASGPPVFPDYNPLD